MKLRPGAGRLPPSAPFHLHTTLAVRAALRRAYGPNPDPVVRELDRKLGAWADALNAGRPTPRKHRRVLQAVDTLARRDPDMAAEIVEILKEEARQLGGQSAP